MSFIYDYVLPIGAVIYLTLKLAYRLSIERLKKISNPSKYITNLLKKIHIIKRCSGST